MSWQQSLPLVLASVTIGSLVGFVVGRIVGYNAGYSMLKALEAVRTVDRVTLWLADRTVVLRNLRDDANLGIPTRAQAGERLKELQALYLVLTVPKAQIPTEGAATKERESAVASSS